MSQQHEQFEEAFRDGPPSQPISSYQAGYPCHFSSQAALIAGKAYSGVFNE
jgi:hypothetical protein